MGLPVTAKTDLPPIPSALADVALIDGPTCAASASMSLSSWHELVRTGEAPQPVIRQPRCTRYRMADVRTWLIARAARQHPDASEAVTAKAKKASAAAQAKRAAAAAGQ
jgi:predicted DNA-binding transcriptional regulator AlpA